MSVIRLAYLDDREKHERMLFLSQKGVRYVRKRKRKLKKTKTMKKKIKKKEEGIYKECLSARNKDDRFISKEK